MDINGKQVSLQGMRLSEIGELLKEASPNKDGIGLQVKLTPDDEFIFAEILGMSVGYSICTLIADAVEKDGGTPCIKYTYNNRIFMTT